MIGCVLHALERLHRVGQQSQPEIEIGARQLPEAAGPMLLLVTVGRKAEQGDRALVEIGENAVAIEKERRVMTGDEPLHEGP